MQNNVKSGNKDLVFSLSDMAGALSTEVIKSGTQTYEEPCGCFILKVTNLVHASYCPNATFQRALQSTFILYRLSRTWITNGKWINQTLKFQANRRVWSPEISSTWKKVRAIFRVTVNTGEYYLFPPSVICTSLDGPESTLTLVLGSIIPHLASYPFSNL